MSDAPQAQWLIDKSALVRLGTSAEAAVWAERIQRGTVRISTVDFDLIAEVTGQTVERLAS